MSWPLATGCYEVGLPKVPSVELIAERLPLIFPEGTAQRNYVIREMAARTVFVFFYSGAIEGAGHWLRPSQITDMSDAQAALRVEESRLDWIKVSLSNKKVRPPNTWYANNSREPVRDETIREGFMPCRAVIQRPGIAPTSSKPTYALNAAFAALFDPDLQGDALTKAIEDWQKAHLSKAALARVHLVKSGAGASKDAVMVAFPNGENRSLSAGPSSVISKAVVEVFAPRFLKEPTVLWLSESGNKVVAQDDALAKKLGLNIDPSKTLPDIILIDLGSLETGAEMLVVFVEVVASDGPITETRKKALTAIAVEAGFEVSTLAFLTAYKDRGNAPFKKGVSELAWGSYAWCMSEPEHLIELRDGSPWKLSDKAPQAVS